MPYEPPTLTRLEDCDIADTTLYTGIHRVEPGHMVRILPDGRIVKSAFWQLEQEGDTLHYRDEREYLEHFTSLMQESVSNATKDSPSIAAEFIASWLMILTQSVFSNSMQNGLVAHHLTYLNYSLTTSIRLYQNKGIGFYYPDLVVPVSWFQSKERYDDKNHTGLYVKRTLPTPSRRRIYFKPFAKASHGTEGYKPRQKPSVHRFCG